MAIEISALQGPHVSHPNLKGLYYPVGRIHSVPYTALYTVRYLDLGFGMTKILNTGNKGFIHNPVSHFVSVSLWE